MRSLLSRLMAVMVVLLVGACGSSKAPEQSTALALPTEVTFVGRESCADCHTNETGRWTGSHHDLAMQHASETSILGDFNDAKFEYAGTTSTFYRQGEDFRVRTDGADGKLEDFQIDYAFGVEPLQQYLVEFPGGRYQSLGIAWDTRPASSGGQRWFHLYPDEAIDYRDDLHWTRRAQNWNYMCAECHSTDLQKNYDAATDSYATTWEEINVSCEACHGPASRHVAWAELEAEGERIDEPNAGFPFDLGVESDIGWVMDLENGIAQRARPRTSHAEVEMCARCHSRRAVVKSPYTHGTSLVDTHLPSLLEPGLYHPDGQILDEVYVYGSFLQSRMYAAGVTCSDCHDPHTTQLRGTADEVCARCHVPDMFDSVAHDHHEDRDQRPGCTNCHMPSREYMIVDPRHDHSFRIPRPDLTVDLGVPNACAECHSEKDAAWAANAIREWTGKDPAPDPAARALHAAAFGRSGTEQRLLAVLADESLPGIVRGTAARRLGDYPAPMMFQALEQAVGDPDPLVRLGALGALDSADLNARVHLAAPLLSDPALSVRIEAGSVLSPAPDDVLTPEQRSLRASALEEYRQAQLVNIDHPAAHLNLGSVAASGGDLAAAEQHYRSALELDPGFTPALVNLADLARERGRDDDGERLLREAIAHEPENAQAHHALGLLLVRRGNSEEAIKELEQAVELNSDLTRFAFVLGIAMHSSGRTGEAIEVLTETHERRPGDRDILWALATIHRDAGQTDQAAQYARTLVAEAPFHRGAQQLLAQLEGTPDPTRP